MSLHGVCPCCKHQTGISFESGKKYEQCEDLACSASFEDGRPKSPPKNADVRTLVALGCCPGKNPRPERGGVAFDPLAASDLPKDDKPAA